MTDKISHEVLKTIKVFYTSSNNALGILTAYWLDGDNLEFELQRDTTQEVGIRERETNYLPEKSECSVKGVSFYECFLPKLLEKDFETCPKKCLPFIMKGLVNTSIPTCEKNSEEWSCAKFYMFAALSNVSVADLCPRSCKINEYTGRITYTGRYVNIFAFATNSVINLHLIL